MRDTPKEKQYTTSAQQSRKYVDHLGNFRRRGCQLAKQIGHQHIEGCTWWMPHLQLVSRNYKLGTIPKTSRWLCRATIHDGSGKKHYPSHHIVNKSKTRMCKHKYVFIVFMAKVGTIFLSPGKTNLTLSLHFYYHTQIVWTHSSEIHIPALSTRWNKIESRLHLIEFPCFVNK